MTAPLLWAIPLGFHVLRHPRAKRVGQAAAWALAVLVGLAGAIVQYRAWHRALPTDPAETARRIRAYDAVDRDSRARGCPGPCCRPTTSRTASTRLALNVGTYERTGRLVHARYGLGSSIGAIGQDEALAWSTPQRLPRADPDRGTPAVPGRPLAGGSPSRPRRVLPGFDALTGPVPDPWPGGGAVRRGRTMTGDLSPVPVGGVHEGNAGGVAS